MAIALRPQICDVTLTSPYVYNAYAIIRGPALTPLPATETEKERGRVREGGGVTERVGVNKPLTENSCR